MEALLPRHLELVYEINRHFLDEVRAKFPGDAKRLETLSLIDERGERRVRMANIAIVASTRVNGVSALHSQLMVDTIFADFAAMYPDRFMNVTNGVTPRRWLEQANPSLSTLLDSTIGQKWRRELSQLTRLADHASDEKLGTKFLAVKRENKQRLADYIRRELGISVNVDSVFDVQIKRIHEYKRQLLNVLHVIARYQAIVANPNANWVPRTVIFAGKAASAYVMAKSVIRLIHDVARVVNSDPRVGDKFKVVFLPNYSVSLAVMIIPAADLSEQISTAGTEASGTGNMKFGLNGALTIGTWDGANIEMAEHMGVENMFVFGLRTPQVAALKAVGYDPRLYIEENKTLANVVAAIGNGAFSWDEPERYRSVVQSLTQHDPYLLMADFADYVATQTKVDALYVDSGAWAERALRNIAGMGFFSTDRTIREYVEKVWDKPQL
jgi:glycogen phosphorylase